MTPSEQPEQSRQQPVPVKSLPWTQPVFIIAGAIILAGIIWLWALTFLKEKAQTNQAAATSQTASQQLLSPTESAPTATKKNFMIGIYLVLTSIVVTFIAAMVYPALGFLALIITSPLYIIGAVLYPRNKGYAK